MKLRSIFIVTLLCSFTSLKAQQDPTYTQYTFNPLAINPAYAGLHDMMSANAIFRWQPNRLDGSPITTAVNGHTSLPIDNAGIGLSVINENSGNGVYNDLQVNLTLAYRVVSLGGDKKLSFGLQGGFFQHSRNFSKLNIKDAGDANFSGSSDPQMKPVIGAGLMYSTDKYYVGISLPRLLNVDFNSAGSNLSNYVRHYYFTGGIILDPGWSHIAKLKPTFLFRYVENAPNSLDLGATIIFNDMVWAGLSFRNAITLGQGKISNPRYDPTSSKKFEQKQEISAFWYDFSPNTLNIFGQLQATDMLKFGLSVDFPSPLNSWHLTGFPYTELMANINLSIFDFQSVKVTYY